MSHRRHNWIDEIWQFLLVVVISFLLGWGLYQGLKGRVLVPEDKMPERAVEP